MKGFGIYVKNNLLEPKHVRAMSGSSIWLYLWLLDKMTSISEEGIGRVLNGKPITDTMLQEELGVPERTYHRWVDTLKKAGYINTIRTPYGLSITVNKAEKIFGNKPELPKVATQDERIAKSGNSKRSTENGNSNKTVQLRQYSNKKKSIKEKRNPFSSLKDLTPDVIEEVANRYRVPVSFVETQLDKMINWLEAKGKSYKNYKAGLRNWVVNDPNYSKSKIQISKPAPEYTMTQKEREKGRAKIEQLRKEKFGESQVA